MSQARGGIVRDALGIGIATGAYALSFGAIATTAGLTLLQTVGLSLLMFTGRPSSPWSGSSAPGAACGREQRPPPCSARAMRSTA